METPSCGQLFLIPVPISDKEPSVSIPQDVIRQTADIRYFIAENAKSARKYFKSIGMEQSALNVAELDKHEPSSGIREMLQPALNGQDMGLLSEAGIPAVADPGSLVVAEAHRLGIPVVALTGPSSLILALAASGLNGQRFSFNGYLPKEKDQLKKQLAFLEKLSGQTKQAQIFIETPYRNVQLLREMLEVLHPETKLSISADLTGSNAFSITKKVGEWRRSQMPDLKDKPTVFIIQS